MKEFWLSWVLHGPVEPARLSGNWLGGLKSQLQASRLSGLGTDDAEEPIEML
jgi:hypothetical protein